ncbi:MAG: hypothetical protein KGS60_08210 [Verrucomicrobia bacterium]|nr:hypothetical protein [Verrucomicrobiota bacterium]
MPQARPATLRQGTGISPITGSDRVSRAGVMRLHRALRIALALALPFGTLVHPVRAQESRVSSEPRAVSNRLKDLATGTAKSVDSMPEAPVTPPPSPPKAETPSMPPRTVGGTARGAERTVASPQEPMSSPPVPPAPPEPLRRAARPEKAEVSEEPRPISNRFKELVKDHPKPSASRLPAASPSTPPAAPPAVVEVPKPRNSGRTSGFPLGAGFGSHASRAPQSVLITPEPSVVDSYVDTYVPSIVPSAEATGSMGQGVFPTYGEKMLMGGGADGSKSDYMRSFGGGVGGPDSAYQTSTGIFPYDSTYGGIYTQHPEVFGPINRTLGFFGPNQALSLEGGRLQNTSVSLDGTLLPLFTRTYEPDRAHVRAGPFTADLLYLGAGALYSDYNGPRTFPEGREDGFMSYIDFGVRAVAQLTDQFYLALGTSLIYLPDSNKLGFLVTNRSAPGISLTMDHHATRNGWDYRIYDNFVGGFRSLQYFENFDNDAMEAAGRYTFGLGGRFNDQGSGSLFDEDAIVFSNVVGASVSGLINPAWRTTFRASHADLWRTFDMDDAGSRERIGALLGYEGAVLPLAPYVSYDVFSNDTFESLYHMTNAGLRGKLSENLSLSTSAGYLWTTDLPADRESLLWRAVLSHDLSERTVQSVGIGRNFFANDFSDEFAVASLLNYRISHRVSNRIYGSTFLSHTKAEPLGNVGDQVTSDTAGVRMSFRPLDYTEVFATTAWQHSEHTPQTLEMNRSIYQVGVNQRILSRLTAGLLAQYEEADFFDEYLYRLTIRRYF